MNLQELECEYKAFCLKKRCKFLLFACLFFALCGGTIFAFNAYKEKQIALDNSQKEKKELQKRLELAKIEQQKMQILRQKEQEAKEQERLEEAKIEPETEPKFLINSSPMNANAMQKEFAKSQNADTALKLANFYLAKKEYKEAMKWSIRADDIVKDKGEAWQIYIKALVALGQKEQALRVYEVYKKHYALQNPALMPQNSSSKELR